MSEQAAEPNLDGPLDEALEELVSAEDFLNFFGVPFVPSVVQVNRLHIMQRYHDYLCQAAISSTCRMPCGTRCIASC